MKILAIGDQHFKLEYPYGDLIADGRRDERAQVLRTIHEAAKDCDTVVMMGDGLDKRHNHSSVINDFVDFLAGFDNAYVYVISGNHETYDGDKTAIDFLVGRGLGWFVTPNNGPYYVGERRVGLVPYMTNASLGASNTAEATEKLMQEIEKHKYDVIFLHHAISGTETAGAMSDLFDEIVLPKERLEAVAKLVVGGHIHQPQVNGRTIVTGNIFSHEMGDTEKFVWKIDTEVGTHEKIPLPIRPIYKSVNPTIKELDTLNKHSIIKVILTEKGQDVEAIKDSIKDFDAHVLVEQYPDERKRMQVDSNQTLDLSIESLLDLYAKAKKKDAKRLKEAFALINET